MIATRLLEHARDTRSASRTQRSQLTIASRHLLAARQAFESKAIRRRYLEAEELALVMACGYLGVLVGGERGRRRRADRIGGIGRANLSVRVLFQEPRQHAIELVRIDGLGEMVIESRDARGLFVVVLSPAGECNQHGVATPGFEPHPPRDLISAHARHADVDDRGMRPFAGAELKGF